MSTVTKCDNCMKTSMNMCSREDTMFLGDDFRVSNDSEDLCARCFIKLLKAAIKRYGGFIK